MADTTTADAAVSAPVRKPRPRAKPDAELTARMSASRALCLSRQRAIPHPARAEASIGTVLTGTSLANAAYYAEIVAHTPTRVVVRRVPGRTTSLGPDWMKWLPDTDWIKAHPYEPAKQGDGKRKRVESSDDCCCDHRGSTFLASLVASTDAATGRVTYRVSHGRHAPGGLAVSYQTWRGEEDTVHLS